VAFGWPQTEAVHPDHNGLFDRVMRTPFALLDLGHGGSHWYCFHLLLSSHFFAAILSFDVVAPAAVVAAEALGAEYHPPVGTN
jgi:hypothetical protein